MYSVTEIQNGKILFVLPNCRKRFTSEGKFIKLNSNGMALLDKDAKVSVCKILPFVFQQILMAKNRQSLHYDAIIEKYGLGQHIGVDEEEILLASLEVVETL